MLINEGEMILFIFQKIIYPDRTEEDPSVALFHEIVINISHILIATNSAVNIVIYFLKVQGVSEKNDSFLFLSFFLVHPVEQLWFSFQQI